jgi:hypothetical protein
MYAISGDGKMSITSARRWLGWYFLIITAVSGAYILLLGETPYLPITREDASDTSLILLPVLLGQIAAICHFSLRPTQSSRKVIPTWMVKGPPIIAFSILLITIVTAIIGNSGDGYNFAPSPQTFKIMVGFAVSVLNASTVFLIGKLFPSESKV